jgi:hypothetical protein
MKDHISSFIFTLKTLVIPYPHRPCQSTKKDCCVHQGDSRISLIILRNQCKNIVPNKDHARATKLKNLWSESTSIFYISHDSFKGKIKTSNLKTFYFCSFSILLLLYLFSVFHYFVYLKRKNGKPTSCIVYTGYLSEPTTSFDSLLVSKYIHHILLMKLK